MGELQAKPQPTRRTRLLLAVLLLGVIIAAAGTYAISLREKATVQTTPRGCVNVDMREFPDPIIIDAPTNWTCVDYAVRNITVTSTGSLTVVNSSLRSLLDIPVFLDSWGVLRIENSNITWPLIQGEPIELRLEAGLATIRSSQMDSFTVNGGSANIEGGQMYEVLLNGGTSFIKGLSGSALSVSDTAQVNLSDGEIGILTIRPLTPSITVRSFSSGLLTNPGAVYDFASQWGMDQPLLRTTNMTIGRVELDVMAGRSAQVSTSQFYSIMIYGGSAEVADSKVEYWLGMDSGLLHVEGSQSGQLRLMGGNCTVSSSSIPTLFLLASQSGALTIDDFNETRDAGNYDYASWGLTNPRLLTAHSTVEAVSVMLKGGTVRVRCSILEWVEGGRVNVSGSQITGVSVDEGGFGEVVNSTWTFATVDPAGLLFLLNTTRTTPEDTAIPYGTGRMVFADYIFVDTYDALTRKSLSQVSITATAVTGNVTSFNVNGSTRVVLVDGVQTGATYVAHVHGTFTSYFPYNLTASRVGYLAASTVITEPWNTTNVDIYMYPANATSTLPPSET